MKSKKRRVKRNPQQIERSVRYFWGGVFLVGLFAVLLMYVALT
ncbi:hypothetical protein [Microbulbifer hainanensis]|nr:hypothetical protein [Microbulbifer hainanensis]